MSVDMMAVLHAAEAFVAEAEGWANHVEARRTEHADAAYPLVEQSLGELRGEKRGLALGKQRGIALGEKRGEKRGEQRGLARLRSTAKALLKSRVPLRIIAESTGLSPEEIRAL